jgi:hypothetical protein
LVCALLSLSALVACGSDEGASEVEAERPSFGKEDSLGGVQEVVGLGPGESYEHSFTENFQFFGFPINVQPGGVVDVEVTQRGSSRGLDTTLFIYGQVNGEWKELVYDNDDGWGALSKIVKFEVRENFEQLIAVVGTLDARGRGNFRIQVSCVDDSCQPTYDDFLLQFCEPEMGYRMGECVYQNINRDAEFDEEIARDAVFFCAEAEQQAQIWDSVCQLGELAPDFCEAGFEKYQALMVPECAVQIQHSYGVDLSSKLVAAELPAEAQQLLQDYACEGDECQKLVNLYRYEEDQAPSTYEIQGSIRQGLVLPFAYLGENVSSTRPGDEVFGFEEDKTFMKEQFLPALGLENPDSLVYSAMAGAFIDDRGEFVIYHVVHDFYLDGVVVDFQYATLAP